MLRSSDSLPKAPVALEPGDSAGAECVFCNLCGADDTEELYRLSDYRFEIDAVEWPVVRCRRCALAYLNPRPTAATIWRYYPSRFYASREEETLRERYRRQAKFIGESPSRRLLDVGCAKGDWIHFMAGRGWDCAGLEPSPGIDNPHNLDIRNTSIESAHFTDNSFDFITAWAVFEHFHDPMLAFRHIQRWLRPGGKLILAVPNIRSLASRWAYQEDVPRHVFFFSEPSLKRYADATQLRMVRVVHDTHLFGGGARGLLGVRLYEACGGSRLDFFRAMKLPTLQRIRAYPLIGLMDLPLHALELLLMPDWLVRSLRLSGTIVAILEKPA